MFFVAVIYVLIRINNPVLTKDLTSTKTFEGIVTDVYIDSEKMVIDVQNGEKIRGTFYYEEMVEDISLGDRVTISGDISQPKKNTNPNLFNYQNYLKSNKINWVMTISSIAKEKENTNILYGLKHSIRKIIATNPIASYLYLFILGDNRYLDTNIKNSYQNLGISHLFSVSGMHISILTTIVLTLLKKIHLSENKCYLGTCLITGLYMFLVNFCPSVLRSGIFFIGLTINKIYYFYVKPINILLLTISFILFLNPFIIYNTGFLYSSIITASLIIFGHLINTCHHYLSKLLMTSTIAFAFSFPVALYSSFQINLLTIFYNLLFVPLISLIVFPMSLLCLVFQPLSLVLKGILAITESLAIFCSRFNTNIIFMRPSLLMVFIYYLFLYLIFRYRKKIVLSIFIVIIIGHYNYNSLFPSDYMLTIDIGQGDSILLHSGNVNALIDTGGKIASQQNLAEQVLIPLFKSLGIRQLDYLFLTHGDYDHLGEANNLIEQFKVKRVYFNEGDLNDNEKRVIATLKEKKIFYDIGGEGKSYKVGKYHLYSLNTDLQEENDSSLILYGKLANYSFILMGDASRKSEEVLLQKYALQPVDILKVGHHGSRTSSSEAFIDALRPKYALISCGIDNKFKHPHQETVKLLDEYGVKTYVTSSDGAIWIKFQKNVTFSTFGT